MDQIDRSTINEDRRRNYGLRIGDLVEFRGLGGYSAKGTVVELSFMDNNAAWIWTGEDEKPEEVVAEWCRIIERVEDRIARSPGGI